MQPVGVSDKAVSKWETGECFPDVTLFPRLAALFEVDLEELMGQGDAGEIPDSARGGQTKTALLLKNSFCDRQLSGNLKTLLLPFLTVFCGGFLGGSYAALLTGVCFLLQLMWTLWFLGRQRREAQYLREKYGQSFVGQAPLRYGAALAGASLALCALFFVSAAQEKLAVRIPELIAGELHIAFLRLDGRQMSWGLLPLLLAGAHPLLCRALTDGLFKREPSGAAHRALRALAGAAAPGLPALVLLTVYGCRNIIAAWTEAALSHPGLQGVYNRFAEAGRETATVALLLAAASFIGGFLLARVWRLRGRVLGAALVVLLFQGVSTALCGGCIFPCVPESGSVYGVADMWLLFMAFFAQTVVLHAAAWLVLCREKDVPPKEDL